MSAHIPQQLSLFQNFAKSDPTLIVLTLHENSLQATMHTATTLPPDREPAHDDSIQLGLFEPKVVEVPRAV